MLSVISLIGVLLPAMSQSLSITYANPANGARMAELKRGETITVKTNLSAAYPQMYMMYEIEDLNPVNPDEAIIKAQSWLTREADASYTSTVYGNYRLVEGHRYCVRFTAWATEMDKNYRQNPIGEAEIIWTGTSPEFRYSSVNLVEFLPELNDNEMLLDTDTMFVAVFDGPALLNKTTTFINLGMGRSSAFKTLRPVKPRVINGETYSDRWELILRPDYLETHPGSLSLSIKAYGSDGLVVKGNTGTEENSYFYYNYRTESQYHDFDISLPGGSLSPQSVSSIVVECSDGIEYSYLYSADEATVMDVDGNEVAYVATVVNQGASVRLNKLLTLNLNTPITTPGRYVLYLPSGYFTIGTEYNSYGSAERLYSFSVGGTAPVTFIPTTGKVASLDEVVVVFDGESVVSRGSGTATVAHDNGTPKALPDIVTGHDGEPNEAVQPLGTLYDGKGTYLIRFPKGYFLLGTDARQSAEMIAVYTIRTDFCDVENVTVTVPAAASGVFTLGGVKVGDTLEEGKLAPGIYIVDGEKMTVK